MVYLCPSLFTSPGGLWIHFAFFGVQCRPCEGGQHSDGLEPKGRGPDAVFGAGVANGVSSYHHSTAKLQRTYIVDGPLQNFEFRSGEPPKNRIRVGFGFRVSSIETNFRCRFRVSGFVA